MNRSKEFKKSGEKQIQGLVENITFELVSIVDIAKGTSIFRSLFIDTIKAVDNDIRYRSQLVAL